MHASEIVARVVGPCLKCLHQRRQASLLRAVSGLLGANASSLSAIALHLSGSAALKHRIKSVDRLLGNSAFHHARDQLYRSVAAQWLEGLQQLLVVVDWSDATQDQRWHLLRASAVVEGRSITLYEEIHPQARYGHPSVHRAFMQKLALIVPAGCKLIVMTDAGFHAPWFKLVVAHGWEFVGRIRGRNLLRLQAQGAWIAARDLFARAKLEAADLGTGTYARSNPVSVRITLAARPGKGRHRLNMHGKRRVGRSSAKSARSGREPWLLASSAGLQHLKASAIVALYAQRMRIEQSFRDTKNLRVGMGLEVARSRSAARLQMLLLIAHLAMFVQRLIGESARAAQLELFMRATSNRRYAEVSVLTLGRRILDIAPEYLKRLRPWCALDLLNQQARAALAPR